MDTYEQILSHMKEVYEQESGHSAEDVSDTGLRLKVMAGELYRLQTELSWLRRQAFPQTATGEYLDRHGAMRGVIRKEAAHAKGEITFSRYLPLSFDLVLPKGTLCASTGSDPIEYETTEEAVLAAGELSITVPAQAVLGGTGGNIAAGYVNTLLSNLTGFNYLSNRKPFTGGREQEPDEEYRSRILSAYANLPNAANAAYYRDVALSFDGVGSVGVIPRQNGDGTVGVYVWGEGEAPAQSVLDALKKEYEKRREMGVTVSVQAAVEKSVNVGARIKLPATGDMARAQEDIQKAMQAFFAGLSVGSPVYLASLERVILNACPAVKISFFMTMRDYVGAENTVPVLGTVTMEESP
ncbi:MAG: baseplate J/gp47 family protein [Acutalibacter sp.]|nr:baseplate J/gp47 family protein [Acutalibacter sp.]